MKFLNRFRGINDRFPVIRSFFYLLQSRTVGGNGTAFEKNSVSKEQQLTEVLKKSLPGITYVSVQDISGGCGAMFEVRTINQRCPDHKPENSVYF